MTTDEDKEIIGIVREINAKIYDLADEGDKIVVDFIKEYGDFVSVSSCGWATVVEFLGIQIWSSEDDYRKYIDETDEYEPLAPYLEKKIEDMLSVIRMVRI